MHHRHHQVNSPTNFYDYLNGNDTINAFNFFFIMLTLWFMELLRSSKKTMRWDLAVTYEKTGGGAEETIVRRVDPDTVLDSILLAFG